MIKSTELRIGNKLQKENGEIFTVLRLDNTNDVLVEEQRGLLTLGYNLLGIPLTEEILLKAGFVKHGKVVSYLSLNTGLSDGYDDVEALLNWSDFTDKNEGELLFVFEGKGRWINISHIKYLHQLQNLFYSLTNTELTINL